MFNEKEEQVRDCTAFKPYCWWRNFISEKKYNNNNNNITSSCCVSLLVTLKVDGNQLTTGPLQPAGHYYNDNKRKNNEPN